MSSLNIRAKALGFYIKVAMGLTLMGGQSGFTIPLGDLPGEEITTSPVVRETGLEKPGPIAPAITVNSWLSPLVEEQLSRDRTLIPMGKGAVFFPSFSEPRREPEITIYNAKGDEVQGGQTGERIILDSGTYTARFGTGTTAQKIAMQVHIAEGHTVVQNPNWSGMIVETLDPTGAYLDAQYEVIRMGKWINYGKGHGLIEERLPDIKVWLLPPGLYRISKPGEGYTSLKNYITVQLNSGELHKIEVILDKAGGDIIAGGIKTLNARVKVGSHWTYGLRAGGNVNLTRVTEESGIRKEAMQFSSDARLQALFDNVKYLGTTNLILQDNFSKEKNKPFAVNSDIINLRTNWVRRLNSWLGPYIRASLESHLFPRHPQNDSIYIIRSRTAPGRPDSLLFDTTLTSGSKDLELKPFLDPINLAEGVGVNIEFLSRYYLEANTQIGLAGRQDLAFNSYLENNDSTFTRGRSTFEIGVENTLDATIRLGSQASLDLRTVIFAPNAQPSRIRLDELTADFRFFLSRNLEVGYTYQVKKKEAQVKNHYPSSHNLALRVSFNF